MSHFQENIQLDRFWRKNSNFSVKNSKIIFLRSKSKIQLPQVEIFFFSYFDAEGKCARAKIYVVKLVTKAESLSGDLCNRHPQFSKI